MNWFMFFRRKGEKVRKELEEAAREGGSRSSGGSGGSSSDDKLLESMPYFAALPSKVALRFVSFVLLLATSYFVVYFHMAIILSI